ARNDERCEAAFIVPRSSFIVAPSSTRQRARGVQRAVAPGAAGRRAAPPRRGAAHAPDRCRRAAARLPAPIPAVGRAAGAGRLALARQPQQQGPGGGGWGVGGWRFPTTP